MTGEQLKTGADQKGAAGLQSLYSGFVVPSYGRFELELVEGRGSYVWDRAGGRYLDMGSGIAVCSLGHSHPGLVDALTEQARRLMHVSNLYYTEPQARLAQELVGLIGPGKCFFCNSGAEANEGLYKLARRFGHEEGRFEILTAQNSFHGRTLAGIAATGQEKVKKGFGPAVPGFRHVAYNDLAAVRDAISPATVAVLIEGVQGEGGITPATPDYLLGLRRLCDEHRLLLLLDGVQCGYFRTGAFQSFQRILEGRPEAGTFLPDGISMAKSLGGGFPIGAFWARDKFADLLSPGSHASTFGGNPLACAAALKVLEVVRQSALADNARRLGQRLLEGLKSLAQRSGGAIAEVRGIGLMIGIELAPHPKLTAEGRPASLQMVRWLQEAGLLVIPAGLHVLRLLPPLNLSEAEADEAIALIEQTLIRLR